MVPAATETNTYLGTFLKGAASPLASWMTWEIIGVMFGALVAAVTSGRFRVNIGGATNIGSSGRIAVALGGGVLTGFGARLARGCTSGIGLSGGATLAVAAFLFLIAFFVAGVAISWMVRRAWT